MNGFFDILADNPVFFVSYLFMVSFFGYDGKDYLPVRRNTKKQPLPANSCKPAHRTGLITLFGLYTYIDIPPAPIQPLLLLCDIKTTIERDKSLSESSSETINTISGLAAIDDAYQSTRCPRVRFNSMDDLQALHFGEVIGQGGFGQVSRVRTASFDDAVIKRLHPSRSRMAIHEAQMLTLMDHRNIVPLASAHHDKGEYVLCFQTRYPTRLVEAKCDQLRDIFIQLTHAVEYIQGLHIIHRDIKPDNIMIDGEDVPILIDFGLAKVVRDRTTTDCGTRGYMAPEMDGSTAYTNSVDVYSLAKTAEDVYMFQGKKTFNELFANPVSRPGIVGLRTILQEFMELGEATRAKVESGDLQAPAADGPGLLPRDLFQSDKTPGPRLLQMSLFKLSKSTISKIV